ncbi:hypothetical protein MMC25_006147 [Agyrium rufum]|nr:hypothetical protein [Agyrium rufum]
MSLFGNAQPGSTSSIFSSFNQNTGTSAPSGNSQPAANPFGLPAQQNQSSQNPFGSLFGGQKPATANTTSGTGLFGQPAATNAAGGTSLFGQPTTNNSTNLGGMFGSRPAQQAQQQPQAGTSIFGQPAQQQQTGSSLFPTSTQPNNQQNPNASQFGASGQLQTSGIWGQPVQIVNSQQQLQQPGQLSNPQNSILGQSKIWSEQDAANRYKTIPEQIELIVQKWHPASPNTAFQQYLYNSCEPSTAMFFRADPSAGETDEEWEEALRKAPFAGSSVPTLIRGFQSLGHRMLLQHEHLKMLHGRLVEVNNGLDDMLQRHDISITVKTEEARRRHRVISQRVLSLAAKTQVLRNRGYALDEREEELKAKLLQLGQSVFRDRTLTGRGEEIWARMMIIRERGRLLGEEIKKATASSNGRNKDAESQKSTAMDDEKMKEAKVVLEAYSTQLTHLTKELDELRKEFEEWEGSRSRSIDPSSTGLQR